VARLRPGHARAILRLYRASPEDVLAAAGARLGAVDCPALVVWGETGSVLADLAGGRVLLRYSPGADTRLVPESGHWPWLDTPAVTDDVCRFLTGDGKLSPSA
jgi:pimeloyl-ACP methyl ester carboxylesterase